LEQAELELAAATLRSAVTATETVLNAEISTLLSARSLEAGTLEPALPSATSAPGPARRGWARRAWWPTLRRVPPGAALDGGRADPPLGPDAIATCESCERILIPPSALEG